jgi:hypothetical protein
MAKAIFEDRDLVRGFGNFPANFSVKEAVHNGDTIDVVPDGHLSIRFLRIDTPVEVSTSTMANQYRRAPY